MALVISTQYDRIEGIDEIRDRLGDSGHIRNSVTPVLREASRIGAATARQVAPEGSTGRLKANIADEGITFRVTGGFVTARFGVQPVRSPGRGSPLYPMFVHQGTGLFGRVGRMITAKRAPRMVFPAGGKPWPIAAGRTGMVVRLAVRGQRPQPYMDRAYDTARAYVETHLDEVLRNLIE